MDQLTPGTRSHDPSFWLFRPPAADSVRLIKYAPKSVRLLVPRACFRTNTETAVVVVRLMCRWCCATPAAIIILARCVTHWFPRLSGNGDRAGRSKAGRSQYPAALGFHSFLSSYLALPGACHCALLFLPFALENHH